jgi:F-type H+-transporting ATPase subunit delta
LAAETTVQGVYAEALIRVANEQGSLEDIKGQLDEIIPALVDDGAIYDFLCTPNIAREQKAKIVKSVLDGQASAHVMNFVLMVIRRGRQNCLRAIYDEFTVLYRKARNLLVVEVVTAQKLDADHRKQLTAALGKRYQQEIVLEEQLNPAIIGGIQIRAEGDFVDASLQYRLRQVRARIGHTKVQSGDLYED